MGKAWKSWGVLVIAGVAMAGCKNTQSNSQPTQTTPVNSTTYPGATQSQFPTAKPATPTTGTNMSKRACHKGMAAIRGPAIRSSRPIPA